MTQRNLTYSAVATLGLGTVAFWITACSDPGVIPDPGTGGTGGGSSGTMNGQGGSAGTGVAGTGTAGTGTGGTGVAGTGVGGKGVAGTGVGGTGVGGTGVGGTGVAGTGVAGTGVAGTGVAGTGTGGASDGGTGFGGKGAGGKGAGGGSDGGSAGTASGAGGTAAGTGGSGTAGSGTGGGPGGGDDIDSGMNTMGWIGCSMANNVAEGYARIGGTRMWGGYGNGGAVVQNWTNVNSNNWNGFDDQVGRFGMPKAVWIMICVFTSGATMQEIKQMVANAKTHAPGAYLYISGQPLYHEGHICTLAGDGMPETTDMQAQQAAMEDPDLHYVGVLGPLNAGEYAGDSCHTNNEGGDKIGRQVRGIWGDPP